ncbi:hypothetical protein [Micromonospora sicca]|uniref:hypothetical protein n=1 Tax=Micromonospora sicca TaxID=2202420 RepID=UPI003F6C6E9C
MIRALRCGLVFVDQPAEDRSPVDPSGVEVNGVRRRFRWPLIQRLVWSMAVVVAGVPSEHGREVALADDEYSVGALPAYGAHPPLGEGVCAGVPAAGF